MFAQFHVTRRDQCVLDMTYQESSSGDVFTQSIAWETFINATSRGDLRIGFSSIAGSGTVDCPDKHYLSTAESCISVPTCSDHVPDFAYDPMSNSCRDLDGELSLQDLQELPSIDPDSSWSSQYYINLQVKVSQDCINLQPEGMCRSAMVKSSSSIRGLFHQADLQ
uniref:(California timema) hypothetical protein n=1 Tax=Timema californicum TaxID=61474 RepID=A0A7R9JHQ2_TIMCA|nr:unnamed protein product [Timema californicum]